MSDIEYTIPSPESLKWEWCWHCMGAYTCCPRCDTNSCSCGCSDPGLDGKCPLKEWWDVVIQAEELKLYPTFPTEEEIINGFGLSRYKVGEPISIDDYTKLSAAFIKNDMDIQINIVPDEEEEIEVDGERYWYIITEFVGKDVDKIKWGNMYNAIISNEFI